MNSSPGPAEAMATQQSKDSEATRNRELGVNDQELGQFTGPAGDTPFYRSEVATGRQSTSRAYDSAKSAVRANAHAAGYGYEAPMTQAADAGMERSEASDLAEVPRAALRDSSQLGLQAAGIRSGEVSAFNPAPLTSTAVNAESQRRANLTNALMGVGKMGVQAAGMI